MEGQQERGGNKYSTPVNSFVCVYILRGNKRVYAYFRDSINFVEKDISTT